MKKIKCILLVMLMAGFTFNCNAQQITLDPTLDFDGIKEYNPNMYGCAINSIAQQPDGKIVYVASGAPQGTNSNVYIAGRFFLNGDPDTSFGTGGIVQGGFDSVLTSTRKILLQPDGKIVIGGSTSANPIAFAGVRRLNSDGTIDTTFNTTGTALLDLTPDFEMVSDMLLQPDDKIVIGGYSTAGTGYSGAFLTRVLPGGTLDTTFNGTGIVQNLNYMTDYDQTNSMVLQPDGKIVILQNTLYNNEIRNRLKRYNADGTIDTTFGTNGIVMVLIGISDDYPGVVALQTDGKIVVAGSTTVPIPGNPNFSEADDAIGRYNSDGTIDSTFNFDGKLIQPVGHYSDTPTSIEIDSLGNIYIAGYTNNAPPCLFCVDLDMTLLKLTPAGLLDSGFATNGIESLNFGVQDNVPWDMLIQQDGKFLLAGHSSILPTSNQMALVRYMVGPNSIHDVERQTVQVYPNPFNDELTIIPTNENENILLSITDIAGKLIFTKSFYGQSKFSTDGWARGCYFYTVTFHGQTFLAGKLIKAD